MIAAGGGLALAGAWYYMQQQKKKEAEKSQQAFAFIKPHAVTPAVIALAKTMFANAGIKVTSEGELTAKVIDEMKLIDTHYGAIAKRAVVQKPHELVVPQKAQDGFEKMFGLSWKKAVADGKVYNAADAAEKLGIDGAGLDAEWGKLDRKKNLIKFGGGFYCGKVGELYVMNGFYMAMRAAYTAPGKKIYWCVRARGGAASSSSARRPSSRVSIISRPLGGGGVELESPPPDPSSRDGGGGPVPPNG
jgi:hypothetical protein